MSPRSAQPTSLRILAILIFIGLPAGLAAFTAINLLQVSDDRFTIEEKEMQVAALTRRLNARAADGKPVSLASLYIDGASQTLASANLQQQLVNAISAASGRLIETVAVDPTDPTIVTDDIRLKATLDIDNDGLLNLLYALESGMPLMDIETLSVRRLQQGSGSDEQSGTLRVDMTVRAHWRHQAA